MPDDSRPPSPSDWPQLTEAEMDALTALPPDEMEREVRRILEERAPGKLREVEGE